MILAAGCAFRHHAIAQACGPGFQQPHFEPARRHAPEDTGVLVEPNVSHARRRGGVHGSRRQGRRRRAAAEPCTERARAAPRSWRRCADTVRRTTFVWAWSEAWLAPRSRSARVGIVFLKIRPFMPREKKSGTPTAARPSAVRRPAIKPGGRLQARRCRRRGRSARSPASRSSTGRAASDRTHTRPSRA